MTDSATARTSAARCRCCYGLVPADQILEDGRCTSCTATEPNDMPRFRVEQADGWLTIRDRDLQQVIRHQQRWDEAIAVEVAADLEERPGLAHLFTWEVA
jgi:hypothetical protein